MASTPLRRGNLVGTVKRSIVGRFFRARSSAVLASLCAALLCVFCGGEASAVVFVWGGGGFSGPDPWAVADKTCKAEVPGTHAVTTTGIHGDFQELYGFNCYYDNGLPYPVGFADTVLLFWSCDGVNWGAVATPQNALDGFCLELAKNPGPACCDVGNPINPGYGNKYQEEVDYSGAGNQSLRFVRMYNSKGGIQASVIGQRWRTNFYRNLILVVGYRSVVNAHRADGRVFTFTLKKSGAIAPFSPYDSAAVWTPDADVADRLTRLVDGSGNTLGWTYYVAATEETEAYDASGRLAAITSRAGLAQTLTYTGNGALASVTDTFGRQLAFAYDASGRIAAMTDPAGGLYQYGYDARGNLASVTYPDSAVRRYLYNEQTFTQNTSLPFALTGIVDELGNRFATFSYNTHGDAVSTEHSGGVDKYSVAYNFDYSTATVTDPLGTARSYAFAMVQDVARNAGISRPCAACSPDSKTIAYDANGNVTSRIDFNTRKVCYAYDLTRNLETARVEGLLTSESCATALATPPARPDVRKIATTWNATYRLPAKIVEPAPGGSKTTTFTYDAGGNLIQKTIAAPKNDGTTATITRTWKWAYTTRGRVISATDPNGRVTTYAYYTDTDTDRGRRGNLRWISNPAGHLIQFTAYDSNSRPLSTVDPNGLVTTITYDARGRVTARQVGAEKTTYAYDAAGQLTQVTLPDGSFLQYAYDGAHRLVQVDDGSGNRIAYTLDGAGNRVAEQAFDPGDNLARTHRRAYDALGRLQQDVGALGQATTYGRDNNGNAIAVTDPLGHATTNAYDALNRLTQVLDPAGGITRYAYDAAGNLAQVTDPRSNATTYAYDGLSNPVGLTSPDTGVAASTYDTGGNLTKRVDARGAIATYTIDPINRVTKIVYSKTGTPSETHSFTYDSGANAKGRLTQIVDTAGTTTWTYNAQGRVASKAQKIGTVTQMMTYGYNATGQLTSITTPSGQKIGYGYANNRVSSITLNGQTLLSTVIRQPFGPIAAWHWGNGLFTFRDYDTDGRLASWEFRDGISILRKGQSFDAAGRITAIEDPNNPAAAWVYQYDALDRLTVAQVGNPVASTQQFTYDALGNRLSTTVDGSGTNYSYLATSNQLLALTGAMSRSYTYDAAGNPTASGGLAYAYNNANRLIAVKSGSATVASYLVNALGLRLQKTVGAATTRFVYDEQGHLVGEYDAAGKLIQETVWLEDLPVATLRPTGAGGTPTPIAVYYVHADHLGSPRAVTRPSDNAMMWQWDNVDPFGANAASENPAGEGVFAYNLRFPGQFYDAETGTHYNYYRDYDPQTGRYEESDPIGLRGGANTYAYVRGSPVVLFDPSGEDPKDGNGFSTMHGNWCGRDWSGGQYGHIIPSHPLGPVDSVDSCCMTHDYCYARYECDTCMTASAKEAGKKKCDEDMVKCLDKLKGIEPHLWPKPPPPGKEPEAYFFCQKAKWYFGH